MAQKLKGLKPLTLKAMVLKIVDIQYDGKVGLYLHYLDVIEKKKHAKNELLDLPHWRRTSVHPETILTFGYFSVSTKLRAHMKFFTVITYESSFLRASTSLILEAVGTEEKLSYIYVSFCDEKVYFGSYNQEGHLE